MSDTKEKNDYTSFVENIGDFQVLKRACFTCILE